MPFSPSRLRFHLHKGSCSCLLVALLLLPVLGGAQTPAMQGEAPAITVRSTIVLVPAMVKTRYGEIVFALSASDLGRTDDGVPQR